MKIKVIGGGNIGVNVTLDGSSHNTLVKQVTNILLPVFANWTITIDTLFLSLSQVDSFCLDF